MPMLCSSCGAEIWWARTPSGRRMPVDRAASADGNVILVIKDQVVEALVLGPHDAHSARARGELLHRAHHSTCPQGPAWRKR